MDLIGKVTSGYGKGCIFLSDEFYKENINQKCGFIAFPGTLNIILDEKYLKDLRKIKEEAEKVHGDENHGGLRFVNAILEDSIHGAILFPDKTTHNENEIEFVADMNLRVKFDLEDGDEVKITIYEE
jgi:riboflavin kinase